jgi:hypothetical protein
MARLRHRGGLLLRGWLRRLLAASHLQAHGIRNHVLDAASLLIKRRAKPAKTYSIDVERIQRALDRYLRGETDACSMARVPSIEEEDASACIASGTDSSASAFSTSTASKPCARSTASLTIYL